jgi:L-seryl-tRNA(Ser) seleniumtransferase
MGRSEAGPSKEFVEMLRTVPSVDEVMLRPGVAALCGEMRREFVVDVVREVLGKMRREILDGNSPWAGVGAADVITERVTAAVRRELRGSLREVINATGVVLHTNLGRAPLTEAVAEEVRRTATRYSNLEYDVAAGARGKRDVHTARMIERLTGAEAAVVVNNCAAAVLLTLAALARGGEVVVSRGELIEIGDGFRIPEIMEQSGATLREVGTTNRTRIEDYESAIGDRTRVLLRVHPSNFKVTGFTEKPEVRELIALGERAGLPVVEDLGSGCLESLATSGISEPTARASVEAGFSLVLFSGDKLLGGPQAGIIAGKKDLVAKVRRHPLFRALRVDKLTIAALEATLREYLRGGDGAPALRMIRASAEEIGARAVGLRDAVLAKLGDAGTARLEIVDGESLVGGGSTPEQSLATKVLRVKSGRYSAGDLEERLRLSETHTTVVARIDEDAVVMDLRTVFAEQEKELAEALVAALR